MTSNNKELITLSRIGISVSQKTSIFVLIIFVFGIFTGLVIADTQLVDGDIFSVVGIIIFITLMLAICLLLTKLNAAYNKIIFMATTDELTQLVNRKHFDYLFENELARARRYKRNLCCANIEIDDFNELKVKYGHQLRNEILKDTADILKDELRVTDILARDDNRFICLLPETNFESALYVFKRLRSIMEWETISYGKNDEAIRITLSIGLAYCNPCFDKEININTIINVAHEALGIARGKGRNRVEYLYTK